MPILLNNFRTTMRNLENAVQELSTRCLGREVVVVFVHLSKCVETPCDCKTGELYVFVEDLNISNYDLAVDIEISPDNQENWSSEQRSCLFPIASRNRSTQLALFRPVERLVSYAEQFLSLSGDGTRLKLESKLEDQGRRLYWRTRLLRRSPTDNEEHVAIEVAIKLIPAGHRSTWEIRQAQVPNRPLFEHAKSTRRDEVSARLRYPFQ